MLQPREIASLTRELLPLAQSYLDASRAPVDRIFSLWQIGERLEERGCKRPHAIGAALQEATRGALTRAVVFRGAKARAIWPDPSRLRKEVGGLRSVQYFIDMIALLDPGRAGAQLSSRDRAELLCAAETLATSEFKDFLSAFKGRVTRGRLGNTRELRRNDEDTVKLASDVRSLLENLRSRVGDQSAARTLRELVPDQERRVLINLTIAIASPLNRSLLRSEGPVVSTSTDAPFSSVYNDFYRLARMVDDRRRSKVRKALKDTELPELAALLSALRDDKTWLAYAARPQRSFSLQT